MTREQRQQYQDCTSLKAILSQAKGQKFRLDCGHHVTLGHPWGNDIVLRQNGRIVCTLCAYEGA